MKINYLAFFLVTLIISCQIKQENFDAVGVFEAEEVIISSEANGKLLRFDVSDGMLIKAGTIVAEIECEQVKLQKKQIQATSNAVTQKQNSATPQTQVFEEQLLSVQSQIKIQQEQVKVLEKERLRLDKLVQADAVPSKQLDDVVGQLSILQKQIAATESQKNILQQQILSSKQQVDIQNKAILSEKKPIEERLPIIDEQLKHCIITAPFDGTVLITYSKKNELSTIGKPLFKIANLDTLILRAYITGNQLNKVKLNQVVTVLVDEDIDKYRQINGKINWISSKAEFTPKTIQTKNERANLVYAVKIKVANDGFLKIGMYAEIKL